MPGTPIEPATLKGLVEGELRKVHDERVVQHVQSLLIEPRAEFREWDYATPNETFLCWLVMEHASNTGITYCEEGFGPRCPWGLVSINGRDGSHSIGMDSGWFPTFMEAYFDSFAASELPIWRLLSIDGGWPGEPLTDELSWADAWQRCDSAKQANPSLRFVVSHTIAYRR